jgi:L-fucose isomerase-like protein
VNALFLAGTAFVEKTMLELRQSFLEGARKRGIEVSDPMGGLVLTNSDFDSACESVRSARKPWAFIMCSWLDEEQIMHLAREVYPMPLILVGFDGPSELISVSGVMAAASDLKRVRVPFVHVVGSMLDERFWRKLGAAFKAAQAVVDLHGARIGLIGHSCPGMVSMLCDESELQRLGPRVIHVSLADIMHQAKTQLEDPQVASKVKADMSGLPADTCREDPAFPLAVSVYYAIRRVVDENNLKAVAIKCWPEMPEVLGTSPCYALSRLEDEGICTTCESDTLSATTQLALRSLSGAATFVGDTAGYNKDTNVLHLWHTGAAAMCLAGTCPVVEHTCLDMPGIVVTSVLKEGDLTLAKLTRPLDGRFSLFVGRGKGVPGPDGPGTNAYIQTEAPIEDMFDVLISRGVEHHITLTYADVDEELRFLARFLGIDVVSADAAR